MHGHIDWATTVGNECGLLQQDRKSKNMSTVVEEVLIWRGYSMSMVLDVDWTWLDFRHWKMAGSPISMSALYYVMRGYRPSVVHHLGIVDGDTGTV